MPTRTRSLVAVLAVLAALTACSAAGGAADSGVETMAEGGSASGADDSAALSGAEDGATGADGAGAREDQQVIQTARAMVSAPEPVAAAQDVVALAARLEGRVDARYERSAAGEHDPGSASLTVRVPARAMDGFRTGLGEIGDVLEFQVETENVTNAAQDLDARIAATELSVARMSDLLGRAASNSDIIEAEQALTDRQANLERLRSERARLADRVALSTVDVEIYAPERAPAVEEGPDTFLDGLDTGWTAFVATVRGVLVVVGVLLPWLVVAGLATAAVLLWRRRRTVGVATSASVGTTPSDGPGTLG